MSIVPKVAARAAPEAGRVAHSVTVLLVVMFVVAGLLGGVLAAFPYAHAHRGVFRTAARIVPFPALLVAGDVVWYRELSERANTLEEVAGLEGEEAFARAVDLAIRHTALLALAEDLAVDTLRGAAKVRSEEVAFAGAVETASLRSAELQDAARGRAVRAQEKVRQGVPFAIVAAQYSEGEHAVFGGDLGYVELSTLPSALAAFAESAVVGEASDVLETDMAFWLLRVEDRLAGVDGGGMVWLRAIEIKKDLLADLLDAWVADASIVQLIQ